MALVKCGPLGDDPVDLATGESVRPSQAQQLANARYRISELRRQLTQAEESLHRKNRQLDALHMVWCDGGCPSGVHRWTDAVVTEELVKLAERNTRRLRTWYNAVKFRLGTAKHDERLVRYARKAAAKTDLVPPVMSNYERESLITYLEGESPGHRRKRLAKARAMDRRTDKTRAEISSMQVSWLRRGTC